MLPRGDDLSAPASPRMLATYLEHFRLRERPFSNAPDPRFVYLGAQHERALAHLLRGVRDEHGVVQLTGDRGHGKTTMCRVLLHRLPENVDVALILNPVFSSEELLAAVCEELGVRYAKGGSGQTLGDALSRTPGSARPQTEDPPDRGRRSAPGSRRGRRALPSRESRER